ncbi:MAG TPA: type ISP restriction/modification enzyme [Terriglobales bacterium]|nr:type ISP restriction/modification enzyme [Terriglobales bacterium]
MASLETTAIADYLRRVAEIKASGAAVAELSFYPALDQLLNALGGALRPKVRCILSLKNRGAGLPDGGLFTIEQLHHDEPPPNQKPTRGAIEVKPPADSLSAWVGAEQVEDYVRGYGVVLLTNLRGFAMLALSSGSTGRPQEMERYELAPTDKAFWSAAAHPERTAHEHGVRLAEFLKRALMLAAPLAAPEDVAFFVASYARDALTRIERAPLADLDPLRSALEQALGLRFEGEKGEHFFRSSLIQTLFYGVFSAWALWAESPRAPQESRFGWRGAAWLLRIPVLRKLFHELVDPTRLESLGLPELLDRTTAALERVDRGAFFSRFRAGDAVQYFYEPFLECFDPELRRQLGVWYTPREVVEYMVVRVDTALREELGIERGLADPDVIVLDPCCGTGSFLVEVLRSIGRTLRGLGETGLAGDDVREAARDRIFGFELLPAPFVIAHLQIGMLLAHEAVPLHEGERAAVYLTNALTGWEPPVGAKKRLPYPEFEAERDAAGRVKREAKVLVVLGNPPYNAFAGVSPTEEDGLVEPYKQGLISEWGIKKFNLDDLYIRFFRIAERRVAEMTGRGVVSFISNHSWISDPSFVVLRRHLMGSFDRFWIENMHGDRRTSEYAPDGRTSETVFAVPGFSPGIRQGVAISLWVKRKGGKKRVLFRDDLDAARATDRRAQLLASLKAKRFDAQYETAAPTAANRFSFRPSHVATSYLRWPKVTELCAAPPSNGLMEKRGGSLISIERDPLAERMRAYFDRKLSWADYRAQFSALTEKQAGFEPRPAREKATKAERYDPARLLRYAVRPFDTRWCYYTAVPPIWNRARPALWDQLWPGNRFLLTRFRASRSPEGPPFYFTACIADDHLLSPDASAIPLLLRDGVEPDPETPKLIDDGGRVQTANLSALARKHLAHLGYQHPDRPEVAELLWFHVLAIGYAPRYLAEHGDGIRQDWPRVPLPATRRLLQRSAQLGARVAALLDGELPVPGVTCGDIPPFLLSVAEPRHLQTKSLAASDLAVNVSWGRRGADGAVMPGRGRFKVRDFTTSECAAMPVAAARRRAEPSGRLLLGIEATALSDHRERPESGVEYPQSPEPLGIQTCDIFLNDVAYWANVPLWAWDFTVGGYQVMKKWLSYREASILGREITKLELREFRDIARRLVALLLLQPELDANYTAVADAAE